MSINAKRGCVDKEQLIEEILKMNTPLDKESLNIFNLEGLKEYLGYLIKQCRDNWFVCVMSWKERRQTLEHPEVEKTEEMLRRGGVTIGEGDKLEETLDFGIDC